MPASTRCPGVTLHRQLASSLWSHLNVEYRLSRIFFFQAEDGIRDLVRSRGLGDVYKRQPVHTAIVALFCLSSLHHIQSEYDFGPSARDYIINCLLYTSDAADERSSVDLGGRRIIKKKNNMKISGRSG